MPFIQSPTGSPRSKALAQLTGASTPDANHGPRAAPSITYIPPLIDGACGTTATTQHCSLTQRLQQDVTLAARQFTSLVWGAAVARMDMVEVVQHAGLALMEMYMLLAMVPLGVMFPGALFMVWMGCCGALVMGMSWSLNGGGARGQVLRAACPAAADGWMMGQEIEDERWIFVGGMGTSARSLSRTTLPALAKLFSRTITAVHMPTYGLPLDFIAALLQRSLSIDLPSAASRALYTHIRCSLLDAKNTRTVILAHNTGAIPVARMLRQLYADIPADKMAKLEIYTFGAACADFVTPLGVVPGDTKQSMHFMADQRRSPHIEHFAFASDPFACMGVLRSVCEDLEGRFCGSVFMMNCPGAEHHGPRSSRTTNPSQLNGNTDPSSNAKKMMKSSSRPLMSLSDYIACLFPDQLHTSNSSSKAAEQQEPHRSILNGLMHIDRHLAEKREFAALAKAADSTTVTTPKGEKKRLSWTGLGATASGGRNGSMDGVVGLEMARKGCKDCSGHRGREVSMLVRYVCVPSQFGLNNQLPAEGE